MGTHLLMMMTTTHHQIRNKPGLLMGLMIVPMLPPLGGDVEAGAKNPKMTTVTNCPDNERCQEVHSAQERKYERS
jgi:hypothetical protein